MKKFEIVMLGNTSVGKTSMLAVLNKENKVVNNICGVSLRPFGDTTDILDEAWNTLAEQIAGGGLYKPVVATLGGTQDYVAYRFNLNFKGNPEVEVDFIDTKGKFIRDIEGTGLLEKTQGAVGAFCVIDAAVLMECDEATNNRFNKPGLVLDLLGKVFERDEHPKFVAFVLTKCETYMRTSEGMEQLRNRFHDVYADSIALLRQKRINSYAMAIQTLGCVRFKSLVETPYDNGKTMKLPQFVKVAGATKLESHDCEMPLTVAMKNILWKMKGEKGLWDWILDKIGLGNGLEEYVQQLEEINLQGVNRYYEEIAGDRR